MYGYVLEFCNNERYWCHNFSKYCENIQKGMHQNIIYVPYTLLNLFFNDVWRYSVYFLQCVCHKAILRFEVKNINNTSILLSRLTTLQNEYRFHWYFIENECSPQGQKKIREGKSKQGSVIPQGYYAALGLGISF